jgi:hypothetical protein
MQLDSLFSSPESVIEINGPDGKPFIGADGEPWRITIAGPTHAMGFKAEESMRIRVLRAMDGSKETESDYIERVLEPLVIRTLAWSPINLGGAPYLCTPENARKLYRESDLVRKQVEGFIYKSGNFLKPQ